MKRKNLAIALNSTLEEIGIAICFEMPKDGALPSALMLVPAGPVIQGRDGRSWNNPDPHAIVSFYRKRGLKICIDLEHATELKAPKGEAAPAMAWGEDLAVHEDGTVWADKVEWTPKGSDYVANREYSYYSPAYFFDTKTMNLVGVKSVGLTNTPNLNIPALNSEHSKEDSMLKRLIVLLGLNADSTEDVVLNSITTLKADHAIALNAAASPPVDKFIPRADYDLALNRATTAEAGLKAIQDAQLETAINTEIEAALKAGKITPGTKEYHVAQCKQEGGLERFKAFVGAAPVVADASDLDRKKLETGTALNAEDKAACAALGISEEDFIKANQD